MSNVLLKFNEPIERTNKTLADVLTGVGLPSTSVILPELDLTALKSEIDALDPSCNGTDLDRKLIRPVHQQLAGLSRREAAQPYVWEWLCVTCFPEITWRRWSATDYPTSHDEIRALLSEDKRPFNGMNTHYLARPSLQSLGRNTFARLWWAAETLDGDYDLAEKAVKAQLYVDVFERRIGLSTPLAIACVRTLADEPDQVIKDTVRRLQERAKTTRLECLDNDALSKLLSELAAG